jgi:hypothetical protein
VGKYKKKKKNKKNKKKKKKKKKKVDGAHVVGQAHVATNGPHVGFSTVG